MLPTFIASPLPDPLEHDGVPGHGGVEPLQTLLVTALDATKSTMGTVTKDAESALLCSLHGGRPVVMVPASVVPPPSFPCQKQ